MSSNEPVKSGCEVIYEMFDVENISYNYHVENISYITSQCFLSTRKKPPFSERQRLQAPTGGRFVYLRGQKHLFSLLADTQKVRFDC